MKLEPEIEKFLEIIKVDGHKMTDDNIKRSNAFIFAYKESGIWDNIETHFYWGVCCKKHGEINLKTILDK